MQPIYLVQSHTKAVKIVWQSLWVFRFCKFVEYSMKVSKYLASNSTKFNSIIDLFIYCWMLLDYKQIDSQSKSEILFWCQEIRGWAKESKESLSWSDMFDGQSCCAISWSRISTISLQLLLHTRVHEKKLTPANVLSQIGQAYQQRKRAYIAYIY